MKLPKHKLSGKCLFPKIRTRFMVDVNNQTKKGQRIIALMESLNDVYAAAIKKVTETLEGLASMVTKKPTPEK